MQYSSPAPCGIIQPHSSVQVPVTLQARAMGERLTVASVAVFGREGSPLVSPRGALCVAQVGGAH